MQTSDKRKLSGMTPNVGDFDQDGFVDIYVTEWLPHNLGKPTTSRLLRNRGHGARGYFEDVTLNAGCGYGQLFPRLVTQQRDLYVGSSFTDFDNDGWQELLVTADYGDSKMFWNTQQKQLHGVYKILRLEASRVKLVCDQNKYPSLIIDVP
ncbi:hypothetical protein OS493_007388 [Desmophyllum pertusum]|uniref:ASPIC/UnbV domain-containing protein n=1 Tax=Desmophyllum pertusum TaxID=174260 RepID=A0A9W9Z3C4_9CNID|nr:hypothetical protein OS493_007388 [Desmophyllum pertusum]